jgi:single-strand DNA-binding protein
MNDIDIITIGGRVNQVETIAGGKGLRFSLASNRSYKNDQGDYIEQTCWVDVEAWNGLADLCQRKLRKADRVVVVGRLDQNTWVGQDGVRRSKHRIVASQITGEYAFRPNPSNPGLDQVENEPAVQHADEDGASYDERATHGTFDTAG